MSTLELMDNLFQLITLFASLILSIMILMKHPDNKPIKLFICAVGCFFCGTLFWSITFWTRGGFLSYVSIPDIFYLGWYILLASICRYYYKKFDKGDYPSEYKLYGVLFSLCVVTINAITFLSVGGFFWTMFYMIPLAIIGYIATGNIVALEVIPKCIFVRKFHIVVVLYVIFNNIMFFTSSFGWNNSYLFFDMCLTVTVPCMLYFLYKDSTKKC